MNLVNLSFSSGESIEQWLSCSLLRGRPTSLIDTVNLYTTSTVHLW